MSGAYFVSGSDTDSGARLNQKTITSDTGTNLAALATTYPNQMIISTDSSGGFNANTVYIRNSANNSWLQLSPPLIHNHGTNTNADGGLYSDILIANTGQAIQYNLPSPKAAYFLNTTTGGSVADYIGIAADYWAILLQTGAVANNYAQSDLGGIAIDFGSRIRFQAKMEESGATTSLQARIGVNNEKSNAAVDPTTKSLGFEFCDSTGTTYQLESCDGTTRTVTNTTQPFSGIHSIKFIYTPATNVIGTIDQNIATTKTTNLPNSGRVLRDRLMRFGIMTTNTTSKNLLIHGASLVGTSNDIWY